MIYFCEHFFFLWLIVISCVCVCFSGMQVRKQEERNGKLQGHLAMFREILVTMFKDVPLPGIYISYIGFVPWGQTFVLNIKFAFCSFLIFVPYAAVRDILHAPPIICCLIFRSAIFQNKTLSSQNKPAILFTVDVRAYNRIYRNITWLELNWTYVDLSPYGL